MKFLRDLYYYSRYKLHTIQWYDGVYIKSYWKLTSIKVEKGIVRIPARMSRLDTKDTVILIMDHYRKAKALTIKN